MRGSDIFLPFNITTENSFMTFQLKGFFFNLIRIFTNLKLI